MVIGSDNTNYKIGILKHIWYKGFGDPPRIKIYTLLDGLQDRPERDFIKGCIMELIDNKLLELEGNFENETGDVIISERGRKLIKTYYL